jgi:aquaporin Z
MNPAVSVGLFSAGQGSSATGLLPRVAVPILGAAIAGLAFRLTDLDEATDGGGGLLPAFSPDTVRKVGAYANEFLGAGFLTASVAVALGSGLVPAPAAAGLALTALAFGGGYVSGGHYNPAVSFATHLRGKARFGLQKLAGYSAAQTLGGVAASAAVKHFLGAGAMAGQMPLPAAGYAWQHAFAAEATFTALLVSTVLHAAQGSNALAPLAIAASLTGGLFGASVISGGGLNPAVACGLMINNGKQQHVKDWLWLYVLAPLVGAAVGYGSVAVTAPAVSK